jgi:serine phosphatase RsbU (regulator of sigma subunit)
LTVAFKPGDLYVFCTDGVFEAFDASGREFGAERLMQVVERYRTATAREIVDAISEAVRQFRGSAPQSDDMTALVLRITA